MSMEFYTEKFLVAKKTHHCQACGKEIAVGEEYASQTGKWNNEFFNRCLCIPCREMLDQYCEEVDNEFNYDDVFEYAQEECCKGCPQYSECEVYITDCDKAKEHYKSRHLTANGVNEK